MISLNTIEENIFKKSLQKRELGGLIIENTFDVDMFQRMSMSMKDILTGGADSLLRPKIRNLLDEENIVFHHHARGANDFKRDLMVTDGSKGDKDKDKAQDKEEMDM